MKKNGNKDALLMENRNVKEKLDDLTIDRCCFLFHL